MPEFLGALYVDDNLHDRALVLGTLGKGYRALRVTEAASRAEPEARLEEVRVCLATAVEQSDNIVMITNVEGALEYVNPAFERITGYTEKEVLGQNPRLLKSGKQDDAFYARMWATFTSKDTWSGRLINKKKDGTLYEAYASISPVCNASGDITHYVGVQQDVTHEAALEAQLRQAQKMEAIGTLAGGIAHDFNNVLGAILGYTELAMHDIPHDTLLWRNLQEVQTAGYRAKELVQQILAFSRQSGQGRRPVQLHLVVREVLTLLRASLPTSIAIQQHITKNAGTVLADLTQIHQVLMNLCTNAAHAMRDTGGVLDIRLDALEVDDAFAAQYPTLHPGPHVRLTVRDTGHGMAPEVLERIFEPFFTTKEGEEGTGMGLAVVHDIVTHHDGAITVQSAPGKGARFEIYLPRLDQATESEAYAEEPMPHGHGCILFVDDEDMLARLGQATLERLGYEVVTRTSSIEALEAFRAVPQRFDLVITDQTMSQMTGEALAGELRRIRPDIPIILCTGFSHAIDANRAFALGIDAFLMKPWVARDLAVTIQQVLGKREPRRILIVDSHPIERVGLARLINREADLVVCSEAGDIHRAVAAAGAVHPDLALVTLPLRGSVGLDPIKDLLRQALDLPILVLSRYDELLYAEEVLRVGARGYLMKEAPTSRVLEALRQVLRGQIYVSERMATRILHLSVKDDWGAWDECLAQLSKREHDVFRLLSQHYSTRQIAEQWGVSIKTVEKYRSRIMQKLGLANAAELVRYALHRVHNVDTG